MSYKLIRKMFPILISKMLVKVTLHRENDCLSLFFQHAISWLTFSSRISPLPIQLLKQRPHKNAQSPCTKWVHGRRNFLLFSDPVRSRTFFITKQNRQCGRISFHGGDLSHNPTVQSCDGPFQCLRMLILGSQIPSIMSNERTRGKQTPTE